MSTSFPLCMYVKACIAKLHVCVHVYTLELGFPANAPRVLCMQDGVHKFSRQHVRVYLHAYRSWMRLPGT